jgi:AcrR family transcriptional regulator
MYKLSREFLMEPTMRMGQQAPTKEDGRVLRGDATRERVLDAAERLFSDHGFDAVSIRQIAQEAGVTLGVVGFHGGAKMELFTTILARRVATLTAARREALIGLRTSGRPITIADLVRAYMMPYIEIASSGDRQWRSYAKLIALTVSDERWHVHVRDLYDPMAREYLAAMREVHPGADRGKLGATLVMSVAAMLSTVASTIRIIELSQDEAADLTLPRPPLTAYAETLLDFCTGGIERAALEAPAASPR